MMSTCAQCYTDAASCAVATNAVCTCSVVAAVQQQTLAAAVKPPKLRFVTVLLLQSNTVLLLQSDWTVHEQAHAAGIT